MAHPGKNVMQLGAAASTNPRMIVHSASTTFQISGPLAAVAM
jgi:hypothetical protein